MFTTSPFMRAFITTDLTILTDFRINANSHSTTHRTNQSNNILNHQHAHQAHPPHFRSTLPLRSNNQLHQPYPVSDCSRNLTNGASSYPKQPRCCAGGAVYCTGGYYPLHRVISQPRQSQQRILSIRRREKPWRCSADLYSPGA